jgi:hypothetical protein
MSWPVAWVERTRAPTPAATLILQVKIVGGGARSEAAAALAGYMRAGPTSQVPLHPRPHAQIDASNVPGNRRVRGLK